MEILYDSRELHYKKPFGCLSEGESCLMRILIPEGNQAEQAYICFERDGGEKFDLPMKKKRSENGYDIFESVFELYYTGLYFYSFRYKTSRGDDCPVLRKGPSGTALWHGELWQLTCYGKDYRTPREFWGGVFYQIFPDRFFKGDPASLEGKLEPYIVHEDWFDEPEPQPGDGRPWCSDFFGGNLDGIIKKLPYLKSLNVEAIYLNPVFMAQSNHRYDTADYKRIDPMLGSEEDFKRLCDSAHSLGIKIVLDGVFSHTGSNSIYFDREGIFGTGAYAGARDGGQSDYAGWFNINVKDGKYDSWWGIETLPALNKGNPDYIGYIAAREDSVVRRWLRLGADGFRLDVADELPDDFIKALRKAIKEENPDALLIGEVWEDASNKIAYSKRRKYLQGKELDSVMNYPFQESIKGFARGNLDGLQIAQCVMGIVENYPEMSVHCLWNSLGTHDTLRALTSLGPDIGGLSRHQKRDFRMSEDDRKTAIKRLKLAAFLQFTLPGCPCIYYGDEAGMEGYEDPFNRRPYPWGREDGELIEFYRALTGVRVYPSLRRGDIRVTEGAGGIFSFVRRAGDETAVARVDRDAFSCRLSVDGRVVFEF